MEISHQDGAPKIPAATVEKSKITFNDPRNIDTFYEFFNASRCKTAMLVITMIIFLGIVIGEVRGIHSEPLSLMGIGIIGYWSGRTTKANDPANVQE